MLSLERQAAILQVLKERGCATVDYLGKRLYVSNATVRRDLADMEARGLLKRVRGGAALPEGGGNDAPLLLRETKNQEKKNAIAALAVELLRDSAIVFLDSSSTVTALARRMGDLQNLTVLTSGIVTLGILNDAAPARLLSCGGVLRNQSSFTGASAIRTIEAFHADFFFFSCCGFSPEFGSTEAEEENAAVKRAMLANARTRVLLCDSTKFGQDYLCRMCGLEQIDYILTDRRPDIPLPERWQGTLLYPGGKVSPGREH